MNRRSPKRWAQAGIACVALLVVSETLLLLASHARGPVDVDIGPSTGDYLSGFAESEERPGVSFRWTHGRASLSTRLLSSSSSGSDGAVVVRYGRFLDGTARVRLYLDGQPAGSFEARPGRFRVQRTSVRFNGTPLRLEFLTDDPAPEKLGIAVDWVRLEGTDARLPYDFWPPRLLIVGLFLVCLLSGLPLRHSFAAALILAAAQAAWFAMDPFGMAHVSGKIASRTVLLGGIAVLLSRWISEAEDRRWLPLLFMVGYLFKGAAIFYPSFFSPDVLTHGRYVLAFPSEGVSLEARGVIAQEKSNIAYPRNVGGKRYAFPYSPFFYLPFTGLRDRAEVDDALKYAALAAAAAQTIVVYWLATLWLGSGNGILASLLAAFLPVMYNRLFLAMWPTTWGHLLDLLTITSAALLAQSPSSSRRLITFGGLSLASFLTYVSSLINLSSFAFFYAALQKRLAPLLVCVVTATIAVAVLYSSFTWTFLTEIVPNLGNSPQPASGIAGASGFWAAWRRPFIFYDVGYLALGAAGMVLVYRRREPNVFRPMLAYLLTFVFLLSLRGLSGGLFKDLKEILFVGPLIAIGASASILEIAKRGRAGRIAAVLIVFGLLVVWAARYRADLQTFCSFAGLPG